MRTKRRQGSKHYTILCLLIAALVSGSFKPVYRSPFGVKTVVIDAGHGGKDPGCSGIKYKEKDVALAVSLKLGKFIEQNCKDVKVIYTRSTDVFVELQERAAIANRNNADLFICIHCNANPKKDAHGSETYVMGLHKTHGNLEVAKRENASILLEDNYKKKYEGFDPNSDEGNIILSYYQNTYLQQSLNLASKIQKHYKNTAKRNDKEVRQAGFLVLWKTSMPSLLTETGFLTNPDEEKFLGSDKGQEYLALSIFKAFREYKDEIEGRKEKYEDEIEKIQPYEAPKDTSVHEDVPEKKEIKDSVKRAPESRKEEVKIQEVDTTRYIFAKPNSKKEKGEKKKKKKEKKESATSKSAPENKNSSPGKVSYSVMLLSSDKKIVNGSDKFKGVDNIQEIEEKGMYKYTAGNCETMSEAAKLQGDVRKKGFADAFVVAFKDGKRITIEEAKRK